MDAQIVVHGLDDFRRDLRRVDPRLAKTLQIAHKSIAVKAVDRVKPAVGSLPSPGGGQAVGGITPRATQKAAKIAFSQANRSKPLIASILGATWHPVWGNFVKVSSMKNRLWQQHLGSNWTYSQLYGAGPALVNIADTFALDEYSDAIMDAFAVAFPEGS